MENKDTAETKPTPAPTAPVAKAKGSMVTSSVDIDFTEFGWGISAGEKRELPVDEVAQKVILSSEYITIAK